jgi:uncharacterized OB-fold protein
VKLKTPPDEHVKIARDKWTGPFWEAAAQHQLAIPRCTNCGRFRLPPGPFCPRCRASEVDLVELSGRGRVFTYTIIYHPVMPSLADSVPYAVAAVDLEGAEDVRLMGNIIDADTDDVRIGMEVEVVWVDVAPDVTVPRFRRI